MFLFGIQKYNYYIDLQIVVPKITEQPVTVRIKEGESASFKCAISTRNSLSTITWQKNGEDIVSLIFPCYLLVKYS